MRVINPLLKDDTEFYKQFVQNESIERFVTETVLQITALRRDKRNEHRLHLPPAGCGDTGGVRHATRTGILPGERRHHGNRSRGAGEP